MTSMPASRSARAMTFAPRSWPSRPGLAIRTRMGRDMRARSVSVDDRDRIPDAQPVARQGPGEHAEPAASSPGDRGEDPRRTLRRLGIEDRHDAAVAGPDDLDQHVADPELPTDPAILLERPALGQVEDRVAAQAR